MTMVPMQEVVTRTSCASCNAKRLPNMTLTLP